MRITKKDLEAKISTINTLLGTPQQPWKKDEKTGKYNPQSGCYTLSAQNGGYSLTQMDPKGGSGEIDVFAHASSFSAKELYIQLRAMVIGIETAKKQM